MRRALLALAAVLVALAAPAAARAAAVEHGSLAPFGHAEFPERAYALTLPRGVHPSPRAVSVTENGGAVRSLEVVPAGARERSRLGLVLLLDTSDSMAGEPLRDAVAAARAFAARRDPQRPLAVVGFDANTETLLGPSTSPSRIDAALAGEPATAHGTHVYDAVAAAARLVRRSHLDGASVVVLSDGSDVGSKLDAAGAAAIARRARVRLYTVGLRSSSFSPGALRTLAADTGGVYTAASSPKDLAPIYARLGSHLSNTYVVRYRSYAPAATAVRVAVRVAGVAGIARLLYRSPALPTLAAAPEHREGPWAKPGAIVAAATLISLLFALALAVALRSRRPALRDRVAPFVEPAFPIVPLEDDEDGATVSRQRGAVEGLAGKRWWQSFVEAVDVGRVGVDPARLLGGAAAGGIVAGVLAAAAASAPPLFLLGLLVPFGVVAWVRHRAEAQRRLFADQLPDNLSVVASALRAGHGFAGALSAVVDDAPEPSRSEFRRVVSEEQLGTPLDEAFRVAITRMRSVELEQVALVAGLQRETGGNAAEVLDRVVESVRERGALRRLVSSLTAQGRMSGTVVTALPAGLLAVLTVLNPGYMEPLYRTTAGNIVLGVAIALIITGWTVIRRIVAIQV
jgi:tight adherence protein B